MSRAARTWLLIGAIALFRSQLSAAPVRVRHAEATAHGFVVIRSAEGKPLGTGELIQTVEGGHVRGELVLDFSDGSVHDETTVFSQQHDFRLVSYRLREHGPSFPQPEDSAIDVASSTVTAHRVGDPSGTTEAHHVQIPDDVANGLITVLLKNLVPSTSGDVTLIATPSKPQVVGLKLRPEGEREFSVDGRPVRAVHYVVHIHIGGIRGVFASLLGKQPPDRNFWIVDGKAPLFVAFAGPLYEGGPVWTIELAGIQPVHASAALKAAR